MADFPFRFVSYSLPEAGCILPLVVVNRFLPWQTSQVALMVAHPALKLLHLSLVARLQASFAIGSNLESNDLLTRVVWAIQKHFGLMSDVVVRY